jgi:hypothetical protein
VQLFRIFHVEYFHVFFMFSTVLFTDVNDYKHETQFTQPLHGYVKYQFISDNYIFRLVKSHFQVTSWNVWPISKDNLTRKHFKIFAKFTNEISFDNLNEV